MVRNHSTGLFPGLAYIPDDTMVHRFHPLPKLLLLIAYAICVLAFSGVIPAALLFLLLLVLYGISIRSQFSAQTENDSNLRPDDAAGSGHFGSSGICYGIIQFLIYSVADLVGRPGREP